jgi:2-hydroxychromene-2-carboxylate isomerase
VRAVLYIDPQSPYAYLAEARAASVLGEEPELQPIALGAIFVRRGWGSWAHTDTRGENIEAIERRSAAAGLPPLRWPDDWPAQTLAPARAAAWAHQQGALRTWLRAYWRLVFAEGRPAGELDTLRAAAAEAGIDAAALEAAIADQALKDTLRAWTDQAWSDGVRGIPTLRVGDVLYYGDDRLEEAAAARG